MQIFISYAREEHSTADRIAVGLRQEGHEVFFDRDQLPSAEGFDAQIRKAIGKSGLFLFLISPDSVSASSYALTELGFARQRWPNPNRRVLPVIVSPTPMDHIPAYLRAVTILEPKGNLVAEVLARVSSLSGRRRRKYLLWGSLPGIAVAAVAIWLALNRPDPPPRQPCNLTLELASSETAAAAAGEIIARVTRSDGLTDDFFLNELGSGPIQLSLEGAETWQVSVVDGQGRTLGPLAIQGCPQTPIEKGLNETHRLTIRPR